MSESDGPVADRARLEAELSALHEQVKLLVQTEQRLHRSQAELDRRLAQIEGLAEFSFRCSRVDHPDEIMSHAVQLLRDLYELDGASAVLLESGTSPQPIAGSAIGAEQLRSVPPLVDKTNGVRVIDLETAEGDERRDVATLVGAAQTGVVLIVPLRGVEGVTTAAILAWKAGPARSFYTDDLRDAHLPLLYTITSHAERALQGATLTAAIQNQSQQLVAANAKLRASLSDLEQAQAALLASQKLESLGRLAGGVAHDFNNLMTVILGQAEFIQSEDSPTDAEAIEAILISVERASALTSQLLAFGRQQPGRPESVDLAGGVLENMKVLGSVLGTHISVSVSTEPSLPSVHMDRPQFEQILLNLLLNARDAMPDGGELRISTRLPTPDDLAKAGLDRRARAEYVALVVEDTGIGMPPDVVDRVFEPFFTTKERGRGTGLGLASVYGLVGQTGGHITVESKPDAGSRFTVLLPRNEQRDVSQPAEHRGPSARPLVFVVEDDNAIRALAARTIRDEGYDVVEAADGAEALERIEKDRMRPDLILTDVIMPRMRGGELGQRVRLKYPELPIVYMSGYPFQSLDLPSLDARLDRYLSKPFSMGHLLSTISDMLSQGTANERVGPSASRSAP